jgi:hypothetical protein
VIAFIEGELNQDKRRNMTVYERLWVDFIARIGDGFIKGSSSTIRERI